MILLFSGGLDSYIAWHYLDKPKTLYCDLGHRYASLEVEAVRRLIPETIIDTRLNLSDWEEKDAHIPLRNAFLTMIASYYDRNVVLVVQKGEMDLPDRSESFLRKMGAWLEDLWKDECQVVTPFKEMTKTQMVRWYLQQSKCSGLINHKDLANLLSTRSCFSAEEIPCGDCAACFRRWVALVNNDIQMFAANDPAENHLIPEYIKRMRRGDYEAERTKETFSALKKVGLL